MDWIRGRQHQIQVCRTNRESTGIRRNPDVVGLFVMENNVVLESMIICEFETNNRIVLYYCSTKNLLVSIIIILMKIIRSVR